MKSFILDLQNYTQDYKQKTKKFLSNFFIMRRTISITSGIDEYKRNNSISLMNNISKKNYFAIV
jgi:hypothetical protein